MSDDLPLFSQLEIVKERFWRTLKEGGECDCPVCGRYSHFNRFKINRSMLGSMVTLLQHQADAEDGWVHHNDFLAGRSRGFYDLQRWGLIEAMPKGTEATEDTVDNPTSGYWRITEKGVDFLRGEIRLPKYAFVFDDNVRGWSSDEISVHDAWGEQFSYQEILGGSYDVPAEDE